MTTSSEQEAFNLVIEHQKSGSSENDIRFAFQRFMDIAGVAPAAEMSTEGPPGIGNPGRMDLYVHNTCIEFKTNILQGGQPHSGYVSQLDGYIESLLKAGTGVRNGILTDGVHFFPRRIGEENYPSFPTAHCRPLTGPNKRPTSASICTRSSQPQLRTSSLPLRTSNVTSGATPTHSAPETCCCRKLISSTARTRRWL